MDRLSLASSSVLTPRRTTHLRTALLILALSFVVFLLTRGAQAETTRPHTAPSTSVDMLQEPWFATMWPDYKTPIEKFLPQDARRHCGGHGARPHLKTVHPCSDIFDAEVLTPNVTAGSIQLF